MKGIRLWGKRGSWYDRVRVDLGWVQSRSTAKLQLAIVADAHAHKVMLGSRSARVPSTVLAKVTTRAQRE